MQEKHKKDKTLLLMDKKSAEQKVRVRVDIGIELLRYVSSSIYNHLDARAKYQIWNEYNEELLRRMFDDEFFADEYADASLVFLASRPPTEEEKRKRTVDDINKKILRLESVFARLDLIPFNSPKKINEVKGENRRIFIVHGHDEGIKHSVARFVEKFGLEAVILSEQPSSGKTIIEKFEAYSEVGYAIVLLTPDDLTFSVEKQGIDRERARQNVIFELGYFYGKLGRGKVCLIH